MSKHRHKASGGGTPPSEKPKDKHEMDPASKVFAESEKKSSDGFKRGGRGKYKKGGRVEGHKGHHHLGKKARGGSCMASGGSVLSSASKTTEAKKGSSNSESLEVH